jgi:S1-C subfamily serine protease
MKRLIILILIAFFIFFSHVTITAEVLRGREGHEKYLYPTVRVTTGYAAGSGTIVYSKIIDEEKKCFSTYILTNYHVICGAISIIKEWNPDLQQELPIEKRSIVHVEIFKYKNLSTPVGTMKLVGDIVVYNKLEDMALIKLRYDGTIEHVATLLSKAESSLYRVMDEAVAVGCSLGWPPLVSYGIITRKGYQIDSLPYDMSSAQIIFGNSGGGVYTKDGKFIGIPSKVAAVGWSAVVPHMGLFIPVARIYDWMEREFYDFIYDSNRDENTRIKEREKEIKRKKKEFKN